MTQSCLQGGQSSTFTPSACFGQWLIVCLEITAENHCEFYPFLVRYMKYSCFPSLLQLSTGKSLKFLSFHYFHEVGSLICLENEEIISLCSNLCRDNVTE